MSQLCGSKSAYTQLLLLARDMVLQFELDGCHCDSAACVAYMRNELMLTSFYKAA